MISRRQGILWRSALICLLLLSAIPCVDDWRSRVALLSAVLILVGATISRCLAGNWPGVALIDEAILRLTPWLRLVRRYAENRRVANLVVSLTTIPSRLSRLEATLKSLLRQTVRPIEIRLNLPLHSLREGIAYEVPGWLQGVDGVTIVRCEDHGPATKLIPSLELPPETRILVLDDDRIYGATLVEEMDRHARTHPDRILAGSGWRAPVDLIDRPTTLSSVLAGEPYVPVVGTNVTEAQSIDILQGLQSYLVQPRFFDRNEVVDYSNAPPEARWCDDVWISAHARAEKVVVPLSRVSSPHWLGRAHLKATSLARNFNTREEPEARANSILLRHFKDRW